MNKHAEKLSLLSEMIALMKADDEINDREYNFVYVIAEQLGVSETELEALFNSEVDFVPPGKESERILQFHRLALLMNCDDVHHPEEIVKIKEFGVRMGLSPFAIDRVLKVMNNFEDKIVPPDVLIDIFKTYYN